MREIMEWTVTMWNRYWGNGMIQYLLLLAVIYLLLRRRQKSSIHQILPYLLTVLILFVCPVTAKIIQKCIGADVYWRVLWLLPAVPVIALACSEFLHERTSRILHYGLIAACAVLIVLCIRSLLGSGEFVRVGNYQKVPEEVAQICNIVREDAGEDAEVKLAADDHVASYVRVYDPGIRMPYGRWAKGNRSAAARRLYRALNKTESRNYSKIARYAWRTKCDYLCAPIDDTFVPEDLAAYGYEQIGTVNHYGIFRQTQDFNQSPGTEASLQPDACLSI